MKDSRWRYGIAICSFLFFLAGLAWALGSKETVSKSERRRLADQPTLTWDKVKEKSFMDDAEKYLLDHFPFREGLRRVKAHAAYDVLRQKENNDIYVAKGHASKLEYPLNKTSVKRFAAKLTGLRQQYFPEQDVWYAVVPDKNYFLAEENGYPSIDYDEMRKLLSQELEADPQIRSIDIMPELTIDDYYHTDTHWRQERILGVARCLADAMGVGDDLDFSEEGIANGAEHVIEGFYGVYYGQAALPMEPDEIVYLTSETIDAARVWSLEENILRGENVGMVVWPGDADAVRKPVYQTDKLADGKSLDMYDIFMGGASSVQVITSPKALTDKRLIIFRDSFASSLAPLLLGAYQEITLIDLRYIDDARVREYVDFTDADILFLYNTLIINRSEVL